MADEAMEDLNVGEVFINSSSLSESQINALDQLLHFQCTRLERKLKALELKRKNLSEGKDIHVSLNELISREIIAAAEILSTAKGALSPTKESEDTDFNKVNKRGVTKTQEISTIIDTINLREATEPKHVQFEETEDGEESPNTPNESSDEKDDFYERRKKRSTTLPNPNAKLNLSGEVQLILHNQGTCKPCAFVYNKKKTCRNGPSCGFCHHEDHALCTVKRWKKHQKLVSSGSFTLDTFARLKRSNSEASQTE